MTVNIVLCTITILGAATIGHHPLNVIQMLWTNLIMDILGAIAICTEPYEVNAGSTKRISRNDKIFWLECGGRFSDKLFTRLSSWLFLCTLVVWCSSMRILISLILWLEMCIHSSLRTASHWTQCYSIPSFWWTYLTRSTAGSSMQTRLTFSEPSRHSTTGSSGSF